MKRVEQLITRVRRETENEEFGDTFGIDDNEFIDYLNDAQDRVYAEVVKKHPNFYMAEDISSAPINVEQFDLPARIYLGQIKLMEFSINNRPENYYRLKPAMVVERLSQTVGHPSFYIRRNKHVLLAPIPGISAGFIRTTYVKRIPRLDIRRAVVSSVALDVANSQISSLALSTSSLLTQTNIDEILDENYMCVVDKEGALKMASIPVTAIDISTGAVTFDPSFVYENGESIAVGDYIVKGVYTANASELQDITERYLVSHCRMEILDRDAMGSGASTQTAKMERLLAEIIDSFADNSGDILEPPILDPSYFIDDVVD